jgi:hypothetical protein
MLYIEVHTNVQQMLKHPIYREYSSDTNGQIYRGEQKLSTHLDKKGYRIARVAKRDPTTGKMHSKLYYAHRFIYECIKNCILGSGDLVKFRDKDSKNLAVSNLTCPSREFVERSTPVALVAPLPQQNSTEQKSSDESKN